MENGNPRNVMRVLKIGLLLLLTAAASVASAQWVWRDESGHTVYSDQPPPPTVKPSDVLRQPAPTAPAPEPESPSAPAQPGSNPPATAPNAAAPASAPRAPTIAEREQEFRKRQKERADAEKKLAERDTETAQKAQDCERARGYMKSLDEGIRLVRTNPDGSRELMDDEQRGAEAQRTRAIIDSRCN
jgi:type IV secretory pathway VirB10-like protein